MIESEEEFEEMLAAGLVWRNPDAMYPRRTDLWYNVGANNQDAISDTRAQWQYAKRNVGESRATTCYLLEDFAVYVEE